MKSLGIRDRLDDQLNPIVVKELRQAVQSKFVVAVLLLFLLVQVAFIGIFLVVTRLNGSLEKLETEPGRTVFEVLQVILLVTCLLFIPSYTGIRLAAERSDTNVDLLFISTLRPRAIIWGKFVAAIVLAVLIFSACTPFMTFTYLLRGIDLPTMLLVVTIDFLTVAMTVQLAIFLAVIPANWAIKGLLLFGGFAALLAIAAITLTSTTTLIFLGTGTPFDLPAFWAIFSCNVVLALAIMSLFHTWSVALISPPSANRALGMRLWMLGIWLVTGVVFGVWNQVLASDRNDPLSTWVVFQAMLCSLGIIIAINEREQWAPRLARTIPRRWWLRLPAFLLYSGAAGGVLFALLQCCLTWVAAQVWQVSPGTGQSGTSGVVRVEPLRLTLQVMAMVVLYTYDYALAAVLVRRVLVQVKAIYTWIIMVVLVALGSAVPFLVSFLWLFRDWHFHLHYYVLLGNPFAAVYAAGDPRYESRYHVDFFFFAGLMAGILTALNVPWSVRQIRGFRPYRPPKSAPIPPNVVSASQMDVTKTAG
jgi:hypothetical protein